MSGEPLRDGYDPAHKIAAARMLTRALLFGLAELRRQDPAAAEAERVAAVARLMTVEVHDAG